MISDEQLFSAYQKLWVNRSFSNQDNLSVKEKLSYAIQKDLRDEMTHPRVRKSPEVKYELAVQRINNSSLAHSEQLALIDLYTKLLRNC
ncbi:hypothetical protein LZP85_05730 [Priestia flexa]|uniref:Uncharacterized protein n=1 Tax=Priestia flexa TaxID=86664 RepID=A0A1N6XGX9_9BACI|nr:MULTISPECIES: hypothetical protein [Bacillaceae]AQX55295.1 hypothetical protein BC359_13965 [Priestia flexa]MBN8252403.1 hypothetical protein [Priestia flexa]MBN8433873.1 hypothetical protein [Priestia flexa]MBY6087688.1 hypothetical protein [Priestia flexa]MCA0966403.1 hypothetical protein [Priestia flexa]